MSTTAIPKLIQRFRARELQCFINRGGLRSPNRTNEGRTPLYMQNIKNIDVKKDIRMGVPLHNPFLPRALFKQEVNVETDESAFPFGSLNLGSVGKGGNGKKENGKKKERKMWAPPRYSLRRQKELVKAARASGTLHLLPPGPKLSLEELQEAKREARRRARAAKETSLKVQQSIARAKAAKANASAKDGTTTSSASQDVESQETSTQRPSSTRSHQKRRQPRWLLRTPQNLSHRRTSPTLGYPGITFNWTSKGKDKLHPKPHSHSSLTIYATRRRMFKGHKWERHLAKRRAQIAVRMRDMDKRVERFKNVYVRRRAKPLKPAVPRKKESLPF
ncbi:uncharacterized protein FOMMEDRAFT_24242 [Fomitiporia mediterranea MF3/22]|uniref:Large ribosomal subunit protein mL59 domain-containing protein n=1 Tax=Fomitiporia mediterranea (strain MF3/22) TaxID=694068 RepID=R7SGH4_FOMME|nr:uncharacterized protein FOMMEDRAFT_24242 [Fomitiporia mediterranea MF3/22]EJC97798.1 hypothetical protein FOMMEDRAFT_24242 [Fomitiporia mediterranea MF3/22]